ncbi:MAG: indole-3-glycerol phosphate synthase TrpC [Deltaproteobacteria bacterium]|nr:indole-3-glycerol phosphate synthase TrpC [Deltaproteobacteria bacterium]
MASILEQIFDAKRAELAQQRKQVSLEQIKTAALDAPPPRDFVAALRRRAPAIIAEVKRASPSKGDIFPGLDPARVAGDYQASGAAAVSVLTDCHFKGSLADVSAVRSAVDLPILRKDFMFDPYQLYETRAAGADCVLLITAMLPSERLRALNDLAHELGLALLVEVHNPEEFSLATELGAELIGINNRDLHTFRTDRATTSKLLYGYSGNALIVSESGIETPEHIQQLYADGARAFLIGESLLRGGVPRHALAALMNCFGNATSGDLPSKVASRAAAEESKRESPE